MAIQANEIENFKDILKNINEKVQLNEIFETALFENRHSFVELLFENCKDSDFRVYYENFEKFYNTQVVYIYTTMNLIIF